MIDLNSRAGLAGLGVYSVISLATGIGLMGSRGSIIGPVLYPVGVVILLVGIACTILFFVHLHKRNVQRKITPQQN